MTLRTTEVLVIGAGPAGLLAADRLAQRGVDVVLADAGRHHTRRTCPVDRLRSCHGCRGVCNVISGFGGSVHYGDGVKLSKFPSGRRLAELLGPERARALSDRALEGLCGTAVPAFRGARPGASPFAVKDYPVASLSSAQVRALIDRLHDRLSASSRVTLRLATEVTSLRPDERRRFTAVLRTPGGEEQITARQVIAAVGRRGQRWWSRQIRDLQLAFTPPVPSVGVRFEAPTSLLRPGSVIHDDFKTTLVRHGVKVKTFCWCAGPGGGRIKFTDYGDHTLLDGHVIPEEGASALGNFALLAQLRDPAGHPRDAAWVADRLLAHYRALRPDRPGKPVLQWYPDFRTRQLTCTTLDDFARRAGHAPSLRDYQMADLAGILPAEVHAALCAVFEELMAAFTGRPLTDRRARQVGVIGLELENLWDELVLSDGMETSLPGLYAAGDCTGLAQGILQAAVAGVAAADRVLAAPADTRYGAA
ncbi:FAD-dependent oxidoreductase [Streptomyces sp. B1866]|uniref:FAD-dependent oxidoreductase n=1 Tax=Streptomyces sp. B1866 TaxID=3075431 RepID=UPI00289021A0|nr:FAD-dependent oxidoreductase [Streptomyces sp. B1866]MDT3399832.1 FAD-dependent oxidoreductase [Streptomyces sp. B1866]